VSAYKRFFVRGRMMTTVDLAHEAGCSYDMMRWRLRSMTPEQALEYEPGPRGRPEASEPWLGFSTLRYEQDVQAQAICAHGPYSLEEIGEVLGLCRERVRQIESGAIKKLAAALRSNGVDGRDLGEWFAEFALARERSEYVDE